MALTSRMAIMALPNFCRPVLPSAVTVATARRRSLPFSSSFSGSRGRTRPAQVMDYTSVIDELRSASLFDLYRLRAALSLVLEDPERIEQVRARLRPGMAVTYFDEAQNRLVEERVRELHRTRLLVENRQDGELWSSPFGAVNIGGVKTDIGVGFAGPHGLDRSRLKVGDMVGFRDQ